ncbi:SpvB/TcaC N-terminal domain-containing protein [Pseudomonas prosekii]|uniref:Insecticide toxin TcdB middle/N-terminal region n=1 Tax=Pseudomonas prosekii TaxID=1148509 RepID=A0A1H1ZU40_9PSED|nr:SpvB/TcaC N-terminal domain-containing protein [Pseudomonas prosekii]SDT37109.1 Insecticide toxin TcdB middle/N-terminal region [Pseudomonas prosekii]
MEDQASLSIIEPSIAKSASIATIGKSWGKVGATGAASFALPLPSSPGRGFDPQLTLSYSSQSGNGPFGIGWNLSLSAITRQTDKGVPRYTDDDVFLSPSGEALMAERDREGKIKSRDETQYRGLPIGPHTVTRYFPRVETTFDLVECWRCAANPDGFWLVHGADGSLHLFGKVETARKADPQDSKRIASWLLQESMNVRGEHICYEYKTEDPSETPAPHDYRAQRYLHRVLYGNLAACADLYGWEIPQAPEPSWLFHLVFDYGERTLDLTEKPVYDGATLKPWLSRHDPFSTYGHGFEVGTRRLCRQVLMFHNFAQLGDKPVLVRRLLLEYPESTAPWSYSQIRAAHYQAYDASGAVENMPPVEFDYSPFELNTQPKPFFPFDHMPGIEDGRFYQCVDLFGEGLPGFLCRYDQCWYYREPLRDQAGGDQITYGPWTALDKIPVADRNKPAHQALMDLTGDGRPDWVIAVPGMAGFHKLNPDKTWSAFIPFAAFPVEFFNVLAQLGDFTGAGLDSLALIGPKAVRLYTSQREDGFAKGEDVLHTPIDDRLPLISNSRSELVFVGNLLGSDMTELYRIRHDKIECWPNLGHGKFGKGFVISGPTFEYTKFDAARVRIADLNGSGAPALIYLNSDHFHIYLNQGGNGFAKDPITVPWPEGVRYDNQCQVTFADLQGLGCPSLILTLTHMKPQHWRYDFVSARPYLMTASNNNMGCSTEVVYRSSAQEWLDEKQRILKFNRLPVCYLPFAVQVVSRQTQRDEITGNCLNQFFSYFEAWYDPLDREFRGFGRLHQTDSETASNEDESFTAPALVCTWFHTGRQIDMPRDGYFDRDDKAHPLGGTLFCRYHPDDECEELIAPADETTAHAIARSLAGAVLTLETYAQADPFPAAPYRVEHSRYIVREVRGRGEHYPYAVLMPSLLETITYNYERYIDDPLCHHAINLSRDTFGLTTHSIAVSYARRLTEADKSPFVDPDEDKWWIDAHDPAQQSYYLSETRAEFIHLPDLQGWRLGLPYRQRGNALVLPKKPTVAGLDPQEISYERLLELFTSAHWVAARVLTSQSVQRYVSTTNGELPDGTAQFEALAGPMEIAQLNKEALEVYGDVTPAIDIRAELEKIGYLPMKLFLGTDKAADEEEDQQRNLWSALYRFAEYAGLDRFYRVIKYNETLSHGVTEATYDDYFLASLSVKLPDGCTTRVEYDYHSLQPLRITDANDNVEEALNGPSGPHTVTYHGTENGIPAGFLPIDKYNRPEDASPATAIEFPKQALQDAASTFRKDLFSWMGLLPDSVRQTPEWLSDWITQGYVLHSQHIRASARLRLARLKSRTSAEQALWDLLVSVPRIPVHSVALSADRDYYDEEPSQIRIILNIVDGFGRALQTQQRVEPGDAYVVENGKLVIENGKPKVAHAERRWRISERVEYNNKQLPVRTYRPYFANAYGYIDDECFKEFGHHDKSFYDVLGRLNKIINAKADIALEIIHPWYTTKLDFNDTYVAPDTKDSTADKRS